MEMSVVRVTLREHTGTNTVRGVCLDNGLPIRVVMVEDRRRGQLTLQFVECFAALISPIERGVLPGQTCQWLRHATEVLDELPVEVAESEEGLHSLHSCRLVPF